MPSIKSASQYQRATSLIFLVSGAAWLFIVAVFVAAIDDVALQKWIGLISFLLLACFVIGSAAKRQREFRCPDCGNEVDQSLPTEGDGAPLLRLCKHCDILWNVGKTPDS
jgi:hypothetical protein